MTGYRDDPRILPVGLLLSSACPSLTWLKYESVRSDEVVFLSVMIFVDWSVFVTS